jgi:hypothetical protein
MFVFCMYNFLILLSYYAVSRKNRKHCKSHIGLQFGNDFVVADISGLSPVLCFQWSTSRGQS